MKSIIISVLFSVLLIGGAVFIRSSSLSKEDSDSAVNAVSVENDIQIISILARGGYTPKVVEAAAGIPTTLKVKTQSTFDCSAALTVPAVGFREILPMNGETDIQIPVQQPGAIIKGLCSMGMYSFTIHFK